MTAFQMRMLSGSGAPETPEGGSRESALKSRTKRRLAVFDWPDKHTEGSVRMRQLRCHYAECMLCRVTIARGEVLE